MRLFTYNTLQDEATLEKILGHKPTFIGTNILAGYDKVIDNILPNENGLVAGKVWDIPGPDLLKIDAWEDSYERILIYLVNSCPAFTYIKKETE